MEFYLSQPTWCEKRLELERERWANASPNKPGKHGRTSRRLLRKIKRQGMHFIDVCIQKEISYQVRRKD